MKTTRKPWVYFTAGIVTAIGLATIVGAATQSTVGRYTMEVVVRDRSTHVYVMDTTTGAVKWVDDMNTPFEQMKGE